MAGWSLTQRCPSYRQKKVFVIAAEGEVTEPQYFQKLNSMSNTSTFFVVENLGNGSDPRHVLGRMKKYLKQNPLDKEDEAWIVVDQDDWPADALQEIQKWANETNRFYAISIRKFEDWLRLHVTGDRSAERKYRDFLTGKNKHIPDDFVTKARVLHAISQAKSLAETSRSVGNIHTLIEKFLSK